MSNETATTSAPFDSVAEKIIGIYEEHYAKFKVSVSEVPGLYTVKHEDKGNKTQVSLMEDGDTNVDWSDASNPLSKKIRSAMSDIGSLESGDSEGVGPAVTDETRERSSDTEDGGGPKHLDSSNSSDVYGIDEESDSQSSYESIEHDSQHIHSERRSDNRVSGGDEKNKPGGDVELDSESVGVRQQVYDDGPITSFTPEFDKDSVGYDEDGSGYSGNCEDCAHYIEGGSCHLVKGDIQPDAYCSSLYSDFGIFGRGGSSGGEVTVTLWGEEFERNVDEDNIDEIMGLIREKLEGRL